MRRAPVALALALGWCAVGGAPAKAADTIRLWNLTSKTVNLFSLAPAGTTAFGPNQCLNDKDKEVDHDERLRITGVEPGRYDARVGYRDGRVCLVRNLEIKAGEIVSIEDKDLKDCRKGK